MPRKGNWDMNADFDTIWDKLLAIHQNTTKPKLKLYSAVLLFQLRNGLRVSEGVEAFNKWLKEGGKEIEINLKKKRKPVTRTIYTPKPLLKENREEYNWILPKLQDPKAVIELTEKVKKFCRKYLGVNSHSLRYAYITKLIKQGVEPTIVAKITKHSDLRFILKYVQEKQAEEVAKDMKTTDGREI